MELGAFSISLAVTDIQASRKFYEKFGFKVFTGNPEKNWVIMKNVDHVICLLKICYLSEGRFPNGGDTTAWEGKSRSSDVAMYQKCPPVRSCKSSITPPPTRSAKPNPGMALSNSPEVLDMQRDIQGAFL